MSNPFFGVMLGGLYFNYEEGSYRASSRFKTTSEITQGSKMFTVNGLAPDSHFITLVLDSVYKPVDPATNNQLGETTWHGTSRLAHLKTLLGVSTVPLTLVLMDGVTHAVVPTGALDISVYKPVIQDFGVEWRVSLTFEEIN